MGILELSPRHSDFFLSRKYNLYSLSQLIALQLEFHIAARELIPTSSGAVYFSQESLKA